MSTGEDEPRQYPDNRVSEVERLKAELTKLREDLRHATDLGIEWSQEIARLRGAAKAYLAFPCQETLIPLRNALKETKTEKPFIRGVDGDEGII